MTDLSQEKQHCFQQHQKSSQQDQQSIQCWCLFQHTHAGIGVPPVIKITGNLSQSAQCMSISSTSEVPLNAAEKLRHARQKYRLVRQKKYKYFSYLTRPLIRNNKAKDSLESRCRFVNSNRCEKLQEVHVPLSVKQLKHQFDFKIDFQMNFYYAD